MATLDLSPIPGDQPAPHDKPGHVTLRTVPLA